MKTPKYFGHSGIIIKESVHEVTNFINARNVNAKVINIILILQVV